MRLTDEGDRPVIWLRDELARAAEIERELEAFEREERARLGLTEVPVAQWRDPAPRPFTRDERAGTTLLCGGLTQAQDLLIQGALRGIGYRVEVLGTPDDEALRVGREFGNRGQCNPTYFTVGNLVHHLQRLRDEQGLNPREIIAQHVFVTAGACGPCRFGTYATEYRKALRDAGFEGFRVLLFQQQGGLRQACGDGDGLVLDRRFFFALLRAVVAGDVLNAMGYRLRPYERDPGATQAALARCKAVLHNALAVRGSVLAALWRCRRLLDAVELDRARVKPKVSVIGEFWAMTTEGDGNYRLQAFLESEGAEVLVQPVTAWLLYNLWQMRWDTRRRMALPRHDGGRHGLAGRSPWRRLAAARAAEAGLRGCYALYAAVLGLPARRLCNLDEIATLSHPFYDNHLRGGEGHMEVGKLIQSVTARKAHMVVSVKPFGCMPSSGVSDGVQALVTEKYPQAIFCSIETTGDGTANAHSRVLRDLFKAKRLVAAERAAGT
ncbi:2-hydroxyglutaryl-CoA dehydratase [Mitsuaria sp. BK037]|uniref:2-hydroxyglutaryl-CoA dehydratase n=1 Tax=Mitsuaria sp. BK037 TaxID=2587122 RepID=UPI0016217294|nr:2-hydroxyglutaryl-CoA dehydratase [Mitsuaria sp. BK037]MBB3281315.1 putative nucleotide-binding protein (sugar kinase/HSP70/actin superfamily) [Mitsuaria sp. BK037]